MKLHNKKTIEQLKIQRDILVLVLLIVITCFVGHYVARRRIISPVGDNPIIKVAYASEEFPDQEQISLHLTREFGPYGLDVLTQAFLVAKNESGWNKNAKGWNCYYEEEHDGKIKKVSKACKIEDRPRAWSVDCGIMQINVKGQECPDKLLKIKENIQKAASMYKHRGWQPWVAAKNLGFIK